MKKKLGFIGCGNMGEAMLAGAINGGFATPDEIIVHTIGEERCSYLREKYNVTIVSSNQEVADVAKIIVLAVKPLVYNEVVSEIKEGLQAEQLLLGISPSFSLQALGDLCDHQAQVVRAMPNTPAMVGCGITGVCFESTIGSEDKELVMNFLKCCGEAVEVKEALMKAVGSVSGSSPAFVYMVIEAMAQGAILLGIPKQEAYLFAAKAVEGSAKMVLETGIHPAELRDAVCSAGGTTIEGVAALEQGALKGTIIEAMVRSADKFQHMEENAK